MRVAVVGATGRTGTLVVGQALDRGYDVLALARDPARIGVRSDRLRVRAADVLDPSSLDGAFTDTDAVISTLGIGSSRRPTDVYSSGVANILAALPSTRPGRLVVVSASPAGDAADLPAAQRTIINPILWRLFGASYTDMRRMERILEASTTNWTALRPPRLVDKPATGRYRYGRTLPERGRSLRYPDLATALLDVIDAADLERTAAYISN